MVLCASNADHSDVKLLVPPASAKVGDRVQFPGFSGEPAAPNQVAKKKILERLAPLVRSNHCCYPCYRASMELSVCLSAASHRCNWSRALER
jgi:hypothetical protein